jgi:quinol monooxygenase YgiN
MIHVIAYITTKPGQRDAVLREFRQLVPVVLAEKGCIEYAPATDAASTDTGQTKLGVDTYCVVEKWESVETWIAHNAAPHMVAFGAKMKDLIVGRLIHALSPA